MPDPVPNRRRYQVILNRESGTLREQWHDGLPDELASAFSEGGVDAEILPAAPPDLDKVMDLAIRARPDAVVIGGGDGTVSNAARRLAEADLTMGVLPFGTFNLAARDMGLPLDPIEAARALAGAREVPVDMLDVGGRACLCTTVIGFYPALARDEEEFHGQAWWRKSLRIIGQTFRIWSETRPLAMEVETAEGGRLLRRTRFAAFVPGEYDDIFSVIPKRVGLADGTMTLYVSRHRTLWGLAKGSAAYVFGYLNQEKDIERVRTIGVRLQARGKRALCVMIDGEITDLPLPIGIGLRHRALRVLKPEDGGA